MEITARGVWTMIHGMGFGAIFLLACSGALIELYRLTAPNPGPSNDDPRFLKGYLITMVVLAWFAVLTGAYVIYPWYRAIPPAGMTDLSMFPQRLLVASPTTAGWHFVGMEWKEYVAWLAPISITAVAFTFIKYGSDLKNHRQLRATVLLFALVSFAAAGVAGFFGAMLTKYAPVRGGSTIQLDVGE